MILYFDRNGTEIGATLREFWPHRFPGCAYVVRVHPKPAYSARFK